MTLLEFMKIVDKKLVHTEIVLSVNDEIYRIDKLIDLGSKIVIRAKIILV